MSGILSRLKRKVQKNWGKDVGQEQHAIDKLINRVKQRDPKQEKYVISFIHEYMQAIAKVPPLDLYEIEQSIRFVWENKWKMGSSSQTDYRKHIKEEEIEEFIKGVQSGVEEEEEEENEKEQKAKKN